MMSTTQSLVQRSIARVCSFISSLQQRRIFKKHRTKITWRYRRIPSMPISIHRHISQSLVRSARSSYLARHSPQCTLSTSSFHRQPEISTEPGITAVSSTAYIAPLKKTVRNIKYFSLSSLALSTLISPVFFIIDSEIEPVVRVVMVGIALGTSALSTAVIQWVLKPYVIAGKHLNSIGEDKVDLCRLTWLGREKMTEVQTSSLKVEKNGRMFSNLVTSKGDHFYIHETTQFWRDLTKDRQLGKDVDKEL